MSLRCTLCGSESVLPLQITKAPENRIFMHCQVCDLIFVPESFHLLPEEEIARYRLHNNTLSNDGYVRMFLEKISLVRQYCPGVNSVLDYGCGPGPVLAELMNRDGFNCDIYDPNFFPVFPKNSYDLVISTEVFEHLRDIKKELYTICSLLNPRGFLAIMTSFHDPVKSFEDWWYSRDPTHICFFGMHTFEWISSQLGFEIIYTDRKNFIILRLE